MLYGFGELHEQKLKVKVPWGSQLSVHTQGTADRCKNQEQSPDPESERERKGETREPQAWDVT
jgi:hypothetical protein